MKYLSGLVTNIGTCAMFDTEKLDGFLSVTEKLVLSVQYQAAERIGIIPPDPLRSDSVYIFRGCCSDHRYR